MAVMPGTVTGSLHSFCSISAVLCGPSFSELVLIGLSFEPVSGPMASKSLTQSSFLLPSFSTSSSLLLSSLMKLAPPNLLGFLPFFARLFLVFAILTLSLLDFLASFAGLPMSFSCFRVSFSANFSKKVPAGRGFS